MLLEHTLVECRVATNLQFIKKKKKKKAVAVKYSKVKCKKTEMSFGTSLPVQQLAL